MVAIFHEIASGIRAARAEVDRHHHVGVRFLRPLHKFVRAEFVGFGGFPGEFKAFRTLRFWANAIFPIVAGDEISARIAHKWHIQFFDQINHVLPETVCVGGRMPRLVNAAIHGAA